MTIKSNSEFSETRKALDALRTRHGANSPIGSRCSILIGQLDNLPPGPEDRIDYLTSDATIQQRADLLKAIEKMKRELAELLNQSAA